MQTPTQDAPKVESLYTTEDIIKQVEASGVNLGDDPLKRIDIFVANGLLPQPKNGRFASFVVQRIIAIQNKLYEGKSISELKEEVSKERRRFLNQVTDLNSMINLYHKFSNNSMFFLASLLLVAMVSIGILGAGLTGSSNPVVVAGESIVKAAINSGSQIVKTASAPLGQTLVTIIKTSKPTNNSTVDPLGLTNLEEKEFMIPTNLVALNEGGNIELDSSITANNFFGDLLWSSVVERPTVLSAIDGVENDGGNIDLVAGNGITILSDDNTNTVTFSSLNSSSSQFIFKNISVSGQSTIISDLNNDTLTFVAGSNVSLITNTTTDSLTIGVTGTVSNADTLDGLDSTAFAALADNEIVSGRYTFAGTGGMPLFIKPSAAVAGTHFEVQNNTGTSFLRVESPGNLFVNSHLYTGGALRVANNGDLYNIGDITATGTIDFSGATTITNDLTIGDGTSSGDYLTITATGVANAISTTPDSDRILLQGNYWDGGASQPVEMQIMTMVTDTTPSYRLSFMRGPGVEVARVENDGDFYASGIISASSNLITNTGIVQTGASQLILQATGANADVVVQGGLCVRDATACNDVAAGGLEVDTAGGAGDDPGDVFDIAEIYTAIEPVAQGEVVSAVGNGSVKRSSNEYDSAVLGVSSSHPAALIDEGRFAVGINKNEYDPNKPWIALAGRVPVKVSTENGDISPGDPLTSSSTPGVAMKATKSGPIIGKALEGYTGSEAGKIMVFVSTGWYVAPVDNSDNFVADLINITDLDVETLTATTVTAETIKTDELVVSSKTSGNDEVKAAQTSVTIENDRVKENSKILVTFTSDYFPATRFWATKKSGESFTVHLDQPATRNSTFDWLIIN